MATTDMLPAEHQKQVNGHAKIAGPPQILVEDASIPYSQHPPPAQPLSSIAVDPIALVTTECITVTSAMRKHARWAQSSVTAILGGSSYRQNLASPTVTRAAGSPHRNLVRRTSSAGPPGTPDEDGLTSRWGLRGKKGKSLQDNPLMAAFSQLRADIRECKDIRTYDVPLLLHPFLQVIRSSSTSAPITSLALIAITKFFAYNLISKESPRLSLGMQLLSAAITHCRFEATDSAQDEIVLLRILKLMERIIAGPGGEVLGDESVCEMMETGLSMCCQMRLSELLRRSAEISMVAMCQKIFERLKTIEGDAEDEDEALRIADEEVQASELKMDAPLRSKNAATPMASTATTPASGTFPPSGKTSFDGKDAPEPVTQATNRKANNSEKRRSGVEDGKLDIVHASVDELGPDIKPYSLPSIRELFRVLVNLLDPHDKQHTDTMRVIALRIIDVALEVAGPSIAKHPSLASLAKDGLCRNLFQLVRSDNMSLLNESLRVAGTLLATCRPVLKLQQELFLSYLVACLHPRVEIPQEPGIDPSLYEGVPKVPKLVKQPSSTAGSGRSTPVPIKDRQSLGLEGGQRKPDAREAMVESIGALSRIPSFLAELFVNYDCETDRSDLCEDLIGLLSRNAFPDSATWSTTNVPPLCLDALLGYISFIADRLHDEPVIDGYPDRNKLREQRKLKKIIIKGATKFNESPKAGIAYLASQGAIKNPDDPVQVAKFLRGTTRISKKVLGEFISKKNNERIMSAFMDLFDYDNKRVDEALREMLEAFRLPGESPLIERIVVTFSEKYCKNGAPEGIANSDAVYVLTYAIIMLNTDQHNPNVRGQARMTPEAFAKNLRGTNGNKDFDQEYLQNIYDSIRTNEIILPDEHDNQHAFDYAWKELLLKAGSAGDLKVCDTNIYDADMFAATWKPVIATLSYVFMSASEDAVYQRVVTGFDQCAQIAAQYELTDALDHIIYCLATISNLNSEITSNTSLNTEVQAGNRSVMVSETAVKFGRDYRAQLATVVLFKGVVAGNETKIRDGWKHIVKIWLNLFINSLIPATFAESQSLFESPPIPMHSPSHVVNKEERDNGAGLFSSFTSYLSSYTTDDPPEPSDQELSDTLCTYDCLSACPLDTIFENVLVLPEDASISLVHALLEGIPTETTPVVAVIKSDPSTPNPRSREHLAASLYNPAMIYILELGSMIAIKNKDHGGAVSKDVVEVLQDVIRSSNGTHPLIVSRAAFYLLHVLNANYDQTFMRAPVILHTISGLNRNVAEKAALPILKGLSLCLQGSRPLRNEMINIPDFWSTIRGLHSIPEAAASAFEVICGILEDTPSSITADNYEAAILLLNDFATAGSAGAVIEQKKDKNVRRAKNKSLDARDDDLVKRGMKAVSMIFQLSNRVPGLIEHSQLERQEAWSTYWSPIFNALSTQCVNPCREIRHVAFACLQRALLSPELASPNHQEWTAIFGEVLFPLILQLMKPEVYHSDPIGMGDTRVQAATLLCKIFLHYLLLLAEWEGMLELWMKILDIMDRLMNSGQGDSLEEAVPESLKNTILVMANQGFLVPPSENPAHTTLWQETWKRVDKFLPGMFEELFPETKETQTHAYTPPSATVDKGLTTNEKSAEVVKTPIEESDKK